MAGDVQVKLESPNSCCASWRIKYSKSEEKRNALRQAVKLLEQQIDKKEAEIKKRCEEERVRANSEKESKEKEISARVALENEVAALKSETLSLKLKGGGDIRDGNSEVKILEARVAEGEREIKCLKEAVLSEKKRADSERKKAEAEKRKAAEALKGVEIVKLEKEIAERYRLQMDVLRKEADEVRSKLAAETVKLNEANKKLEGEKKRVVKETKRADSERSKAEEQRKLAEAFKKRALEGKIYAETLSQQFEESKKRNEEEHGSKLALEFSLKLEEANKKLQLEKQKASREKERADGESAKAESLKKNAERNMKKAMEEKSRADNLTRQLEDDQQKIIELEKQIKELLSSNAAGSTASEELKLLKKQLKFEKMKKKHSTQVVELERSRNSILQQEVARLKLEFDQFSCRLDLLHNSFSPRSGDRDGLQKNGNIVDMPRSAVNPSFTAMDTYGTFRQTINTAHLSPVPGGICVEPITGTNSKLESLLGGSTRTMLKTPAINSSTTSFSNGQLVGSQDKGAFSVTTSAKLVEEHVQPSNSEMSDEVTEMRSGENLAVVAENSVRCPVSSIEVGKVNTHSKKRKRMLDTVEIIESLYIEDKRLHLQIEEKLALLHGLVDKQLDKGDGDREGKFLSPTLLGSSGAKHDKHNKKRKASFQQKVAALHACDSREQKKTDEDEIQVYGDAKLCRQASPVGIDPITTSENGEQTRDSNSMENFEKLANGDYMNLLNLDDAAFEECYRVAMEIPLSPTLPEIEIACTETCDMDIAIPLVKETLCEGLSNKDLKGIPSHGFGVEISSNKSKSDGNATSTSLSMHKEQRPINTLGPQEDVWHTSHVENASVCLSHSGVGIESSNATVSGDEKSQVTFKGEFRYLSDKILQHCVVFSNLTDRSSISRIYYTIRTCMAQLALATQPGWMVREILVAIRMEEKLLVEEKVCALFSLLMINFSVAALGMFGDSLNWTSIPCLDSFAGHVHSVMSDAEIRNMFVQLGSLDEFLSLIESFLVDEGFMVLRDVSFGSSVEHGSRDSIKIDGSDISLAFIPASAEQLVAGSIILASISAAVDHIGFICETSYIVLRSPRLRKSLMLSILHIFAYLGGDKFFSSSDYSLMMTVLKPVVRLIEGMSLSGGSICCNPLVKDNQGQCFKCPFMEVNGDAMSVDTVTSLLLDKIKANDDLKKYCAHKTNGNGTNLAGNLTDAFTSVTISNLSDILALLELVACHMDWEWTSDKIVPHLSNLLATSDFNNSSSGIVILLGQLGRLGVEAFGYEDIKVEQIRSNLSAFLQRGITLEAGLPIQIATVTALLGLISVDFEVILQRTGNIPINASNTDSANVIRKWFSSLNKKQQDLSLKVL